MYWVYSRCGMTVKSELDVLPFKYGDNQHIEILISNNNNNSLP